MDVDIFLQYTNHLSRPRLVNEMEVILSDTAISAELPTNVAPFFPVSLHGIPLKCIPLVYNQWRDMENVLSPIVSTRRWPAEERIINYRIIWLIQFDKTMAYRWMIGKWCLSYWNRRACQLISLLPCLTPKTHCLQQISFSPLPITKL